MRDQIVINKVIFIIFYKFAWFLLFTSIFVSFFSQLAVAGEKTRIFITSNSQHSADQFIQTVENGMLSLKEKQTFKIRTYIEPVTRSQKIIFKQKRLKLQEGLFECRDFPCTKKWDIDLSDKNINIKDFPHFQIDWIQSFWGDTPEILIQAEVIPEGTKQKAIHINRKFSKKANLLGNPIKTIDMKGAEYTGKYRRLYILKRELGMRADSKWRYVMDGYNLILQSRVDLPLLNIQTIQVISDLNLVPERVQFSVDSTGNGRRDMSILFEQTRHSLEKKNGQSILTIDLGTAIKKLGIDLEKAVLLEPIIFVPTTLQSYMRENPIHKIHFFNNESESENIASNMNRIRDHYFMDFGFSKDLEEKSIRDGLLKRLVVTVHLEEPQILTMGEIRLFNTVETQVPILAEEPGKALQSWKGNDPILNHFERIRSFRPLMWIWQNKHEKGEMKIDKGIWRSSDSEINGKLWTSFTGSGPLRGELTIEQQAKSKIHPLYLKDDASVFIPEIASGTKLIKFEDVGDKFLPETKRGYELWFHNIVSENIGAEFNFKNAEWWIKEAEIPFVANEESVRIDAQKGKAYLFSKEGEKKKWTFTLPDVEFMAPLSLLMPGSIPPSWQITLKINNQSIPIFYGVNQIPQSFLSANSFKLEIEDYSEEPFFSIKLPKLKVFGLKRTSQDELKKMVMIIGSKKIPILISKDNDFYGGWVDLGQISLEYGDHFVHLENNPFFRFKTLVLETDAILPLLEKAQTKLPPSSLWGKLVFLSLKLLLVAIVVCILCSFRMPIRIKFQFFLDSACLSFKKVYWFLPDKIWIIFWLLGGAMLFGIGLLSNNQEENYAITFGGIFIVVFFWHLGRLLKGWLLKQFPRLGGVVYRQSSSPFFACAIALLLVTPLCVVVGLELLAEQTVNIAYYCLVVGVVGTIFNFANEKQTENV